METRCVIDDEYNESLITHKSRGSELVQRQQFPLHLLQLPLLPLILSLQRLTAPLQPLHLAPKR